MKSNLQFVLEKEEIKNNDRHQENVSKRSGGGVEERIEWIDFAKGMTILLVIIGHCYGDDLIGSFIHSAIYSFHMPLFFILSAMTFKFSVSDVDFKSRTIKSAKHLLIPFLITFVIYMFWPKDVNMLFNINYWYDMLYTFIYATAGGEVNILNHTVYSIIAWFLVALFIVRTIFDYLHLKIKNDSILFIVSCIWCCIGILIGKIQWLPFSMDISLAVLPFFYYGYKKSIDVMDRVFMKMLIWGIIWLLSLCVIPNLSLTARSYPLFPICYLTAIAGTMFLVEFSVICCKTKVSKPIIFLGRNTLYLLCIHTLDSRIYGLWNVEGHYYYTCLKRILCNLLIFFVVIIIINIQKKLKPFIYSCFR